MSPSAVPGGAVFASLCRSPVPSGRGVPHCGAPLAGEACSLLGQAAKPGELPRTSAAKFQDENSSNWQNPDPGAWLMSVRNGGGDAGFSQLTLVHCAAAGAAAARALAASSTALGNDRVRAMGSPSVLCVRRTYGGTPPR